MADDRSPAALRLASLQRISTELARALRPEEVVEVIVQRATPAFGGLTGSLCLLGEDGETLELVREVGYPAEIGTAWKRFPLSAPLPAGDAIRSLAPVVMASVAERDRMYPELTGTPAVSKSFVVLPLVVSEGVPIGVFTIGFPDERTLDADDLAFFASLAALCAQSLHRARLLDASHQATIRLGFLEQAGAVLTATLDCEQSVARVARLTVPTVADMAAVVVLEDGEPRLMALEHVDPALVAPLTALAAEHPWGLNPESGIGAVLRTGEAQWYPVVDDDVIRQAPVSDEQREVLDRLGFGAGCTVPLSVRGGVIGALTLANRVGRPFTHDDFQTAQVLARRLATTIDNSRLFAERTRVAETLQQSLLPPTLPEVDGLDFGARYVPMPGEAVVGGDFYDVVRLGPDRWLLAIGDVCGKGVDAARHTSLVRHALWSAAVDRAAPADILRHVNAVVLQYADSLPEQQAMSTFCTVAVVLVELRDGQVHVVASAAGHPLPLLVEPGRGAAAFGRPGSALGLFPEVDLHETEVDLTPGGAVVLYTDGVTERHEGRRSFGEEGIVAAIGSDPSPRAQAIADAVVAAARDYTESTPADDMAVLVMRRSA